MPEKREYGQREYMRVLYQKHKGNEAQVCAAYAQAERDGIVHRKKTKHYKTSEIYAAALWYDAHRKDGKRKPWLP